MKFFLIPLLFASVCVSLSVQAEDEAAAAAGAGEDLSERGLLMAKSSTQVRRTVSHVSQPGVFAPAPYFPAPQPSPFSYMQLNYGCQQQYPNPQMPVPSVPSYLQQYQQYQQPQQPTGYNPGYFAKPQYSFPGSYGFAVPSPDYGVMPNVLPGLSSGASFRSNTGVNNNVAYEN